MKLNFRKVASVLASAVMVGSTMGVAAAASYPAPFVSGGVADVGVVVGSSAAYSDWAGALDVSQNLQFELAKQTATVDGGTDTSVTGGDAVDLDTSSQKLYMGSAINAARTVISSTEMSNILPDGSATDLTGTSYDYAQRITIGDSSITFGKSGENIDPIVMIDIGSSAGDPVYNYTLTLQKTLNVSSSNVIGEAEFSMLGNDYVVGANSDYDTLYLYGSGQEVNVDGGETATVTVNDEEHTIELITTTSSTTAKISIDGGSTRTVTKGSSYKFPGGFEIYVKDVTHPTIQGDPRQATFLAGANTLHLESEQTVRQGADDEVILGTKAYIEGTEGVGISSITLSQAARSTTGDYLAVGEVFEDRILGGLKVDFAALTPGVDASSRDSIIVDTDNAMSAKVTFDSATASTDETEFTYAMDGDRQADSNLNAINLVDSGNYTIHVKEGENAALNELIVIHNPAKDDGRILKVVQIGTGLSTNDKTTLRDALTDQEFEFTTGIANSTSRTIDGDTYYMAITPGDTGSVNLTWGTGASEGYEGTQTTLFPRIKLENGEWMAFLASTTVSNATTYQLPGKYLVSDYTTGAAISVTAALNGEQGTGSSFGNVNYTYTVQSNSGANNTALLDGIRVGSNFCNFNSTMGPAILVMEEKTLADSNGHGVCIPLTTEGTNTVMPAIGNPVFTDGTGSLVSLASDTYTSQQVTTFGTLVERDSTDNNGVTVKYPDEQMYADIVFAEVGATVTPGSSGGGDVTELGSVTVRDTEYSQVQAKNVIVVGGSCINSAAATLLGGGYCGASFTEQTGVESGQYLIQSFDNPDAAGKVALLIAGYEAADTTNAIKYLTTEMPDTTVGKKYKGSTATSATEVVESESE